MKKKILLAVLLFFGTVSFVRAQDSDGDGHADVDDCAPSDPLKWASVIYLDGDADGYTVSVTGCWGGTLPRWNSVFGNVGYSYSPGFGQDNDDNDPYQTGGPYPSVVASGDADNDGEPDFTDPAPNNPSVNHTTLEICNGIDDNGNGLIDEDCSSCILSISAGADEHLLFGYPPSQCKTKTAVVTNGSSTLSYSWTLDRALLPGETMTGAATASVTLCLMDTAQLCLTVTDDNCTVTDCATIFAEDVRCFTGNNQNQKVKVCHNGHSICVDQNAMNAHLAHGDYLGDCNIIIVTPGNNREENFQPGLNIFPNPAKNNFSLTVNVGDDSNDRIIRIINMNGQIVKQLAVRQQAKLNVTIEVPGIYLVQLMSGKQIITKKLVVVH